MSLTTFSIRQRSVSWSATPFLSLYTRPRPYPSKSYPDTRTLQSYCCVMRKKLTPKFLDNLPPAEGKRYEVRDELVTGLHIRISNAGNKVWYLATRVDGVSRRIKLGTYPVLSPKDAREQTQMILRDIQLGTFQQRDVEPAPEVLTLGDVIPQFITRYAQRHTKVACCRFFGHWVKLILPCFQIPSG